MAKIIRRAIPIGAIDEFITPPWWRQFCTVYKVVDATRLSKFTKACADRKLYNCVRGTRTQPILCVGCSVHYWGPVQLIREVFSRLHSLSSSSTHNCLALIWGACLRFASHWRANLVIRVSSAFIFETFAVVCYSVFVKRSSFKSVLNLRKAYIFNSLLKVCYRSVFNESSKAFIFRKCAESIHPE